MLPILGFCTAVLPRSRATTVVDGREFPIIQLKHEKMLRFTADAHAAAPTRKLYLHKRAIGRLRVMGCIRRRK